MVRVHSVDELTEIFKILLDKNESSLTKALSRIGEEGSGLLVLMRHYEKETDVLELLEILKDPTKATTNKKPTQYLRDYGTGAQIIRSQGIKQIRLITNNPKRKVGLIGYGLEVVENIVL